MQLGAVVGAGGTVDGGGVAVDGAGNLFISDWGNYRIRKVTPDGVIATVAGNGTRGFSGDGGPATSAQFGMLGGIAVDGSGKLYMADSENFRLRKVVPTGIITTVASGSDPHPAGVAVDGEGNVFVADPGVGEGIGFIRKVSPSGIITTVAGNGVFCFGGKRCHLRSR